jgi:hypothetical protein
MTPAGLLLLVFVVGLLLVGLVAVVALRAQRSVTRRRYQETLQSMSFTELASEACRTAEAASIRKHFPDAALFDDSQQWDKAALLNALEDLYVRLESADRQTGSATGPGSWAYAYHDCGLAAVREALEDAPS